MYESAIEALVNSSLKVIRHQIELHGSNTPLITLNTKGDQRFWQSIHNGIALEIGNILPYKVTWDDLKAVLSGLPTDCQLHLCDFEFSVPSGIEIGEGAFYKA